MTTNSPLSFVEQSTQKANQQQFATFVIGRRHYAHLNQAVANTGELVCLEGQVCKVRRK